MTVKRACMNLAIRGLEFPWTIGLKKEIKPAIPDLGGNVGAIK
jgi:hypothetical protein